MIHMVDMIVFIEFEDWIKNKVKRKLLCLGLYRDFYMEAFLL